jgi:hypothetical protein
MNIRSMLGCCAVLLLTGCATTPPYTELPAGPVTVGSVRFDVDAGWNVAAPKIWLVSNGVLRVQEGGPYWTRDGQQLDQIIVYPDIRDGEALEKKAPKQAAYPAFRANMLPNEIVALVESTLTKVFGEGDALVTSSGLRPQKFGDQKGFAFDLALSVSNGPDYKGLVGGFVADGKLQLAVYLGAVPYYFDLHRESAARIIASARLTGP